MGYTNETSFYNLPQYVQGDEPSVIADLNPAFNAIDTAMHDNMLDASGARSVAENAASAASTAQNGVTALNSKLTVTDPNAGSGMISFGVDASGNYGYKKVGADTVTPFSTEKELMFFRVRALRLSSSYSANRLSEIYFDFGLLFISISNPTYAGQTVSVTIQTRTSYDDSYTTVVNQGMVITDAQTTINSYLENTPFEIENLSIFHGTNIVGFYLNLKAKTSFDAFLIGSQYNYSSSIEKFSKLNYQHIEPCYITGITENFGVLTTSITAAEYYVNLQSSNEYQMFYGVAQI